jgi:2-polyprenyl-3-methyl-5-hydroxy-6-metoxy-1,4-benzoquinol methylase
MDSICVSFLCILRDVGHAEPRRDYVIRGGHEGKRRLELLGRIMWPTTLRLFQRTGICEGMTCLDIGCGGGDVTFALARMVGPAGRIAGLDIDDVKLAAARERAVKERISNVKFRVANIYEWSDEGAYDRIYARFLLTHLPDPVTALSMSDTSICIVRWCSAEEETRTSAPSCNGYWFGPACSRSI